MKRRDFFASLPGGYSLAVLAGGVPAASAQSVSTDEMRRAFDRIAPPEKLRRMASNERHMTQVDLETDVLVAGGGMAGVCAAVAAARHGAKVVLVQDRSRLGGNASSEVKMHIVGANAHRGRPGWREGGLIEEFRLDDAVNNPQRCWEMWDLLLYDKVVSEPNITLLLESTLYAAAVKNGTHRAGAGRGATRPSTCTASRRKLYCDATGDSRLGWKRARRCAPGARRARSSTSRSRRWRRTRRRSAAASCSPPASTTADAVHAAEMGAQGDQGAAAFTARSPPGNTATGGSSGAAASTPSATTSASASSCSRS